MVMAFMVASLQTELVELLQKIVLQTASFSNNRNLQVCPLVAMSRGLSVITASWC